jgi:YebC/PmpR family DNA-binding regulatory protein
VAARQGGADPEMNVRLRLAVQKAKESNMPLDNIERATKRGAGLGDGSTEALSEIKYEGYAPGGAAILLEVLTDNSTRTVSEVRNVFNKSGGSLGEPGSVAWNFESKGVVQVEVSQEQAEELALIAIDAGAEDFDQDGTVLEIRTEPGAFEVVRKSLEEAGTNLVRAEIAMLPKATLALDVKHASQTMRLMDRLEDLDDVQRVYTNADFPNEALEEYRTAG